MLIYIGSDHQGFKLKEVIKRQLEEDNHKVIDVGNVSYDENDDYPVFAAKVAGGVSKNPDARGIVICGSGAGVDIVANKFARIRSVLAINAQQAASTRIDDDTNVLALAADYIEEDKAQEIVRAWTLTPFSGEEKYKRRIKEIENIENQPF
ncbi:MAG: ribose 5-phosphate isomerase B [Parcubacteria group bacterium Athens0714_26]|nr:MAG: ribose 5-phosphate isomerase B [Parcubacteria group bacterium Athens1014_26]TSD01177.1 MAG: ribose 5-phosphate isomerase B [Parcubacteria group bacterium Athens0714_26]